MTIMAKSADPDQNAPEEQSDKSLQCLPALTTRA